MCDIWMTNIQNAWDWRSHGGSCAEKGRCAEGVARLYATQHTLLHLLLRRGRVRSYGGRWGESREGGRSQTWREDFADSVGHGQSPAHPFHQGHLRLELWVRCPRWSSGRWVARPAGTPVERVEGAVGWRGGLGCGGPVSRSPGLAATYSDSHPSRARGRPTVAARGLWPLRLMERSPGAVGGAHGPGG